MGQKLPPPRTDTPCQTGSRATVPEPLQSLRAFDPEGEGRGALHFCSKSTEMQRASETKRGVACVPGTRLARWMRAPTPRRDSQERSPNPDAPTAGKEAEANGGCPGRVDVHRLRTPSQSGQERAPKRDSCNGRQEEEPDEGRTYDLSSPSHVLAARGPCAKGTAWPRGRRGRLTPWTPGELRACPRPFGSRGVAPAERDRRRRAWCARRADGGGRRAWPSITCR